MAVIDYLQLLSGSRSSPYEEVSYVSKCLKALSKSGVMTIVMVQMNRGVEYRDHFTPKAADAKDSGQIEQDSDIQLSVVWKCRAQGKSGEQLFTEATENDFLIHCHKNRNGGILFPNVDCFYDPVSQTFEDESTRWEPEDG